ncbi:hypothetical protein HYPSUDRAFT_662497 [Hypholoma sublateritium FD-334 SS-4]|uniref:Uncharacterized protein n=1 Tax=Hypholoma sublateritium (strain FD-334 SS-4) TaxID=945553 RepID=A0A0D2MFF3_HYPSF|nr:hypothetical protein HYPSUDRAFT_662497 [Hypholoma sublateritium FD-334 SS-4]
MDGYMHRTREKRPKLEYSTFTLPNRPFECRLRKNTIYMHIDTPARAFAMSYLSCPQVKHSCERTACPLRDSYCNARQRVDVNAAVVLVTNEENADHTGTQG